MLNQRLQQKLLQKLSPQQILLMKLLQIPSMALEQRIKQEIEENPALDDSSTAEEETSSAEGDLPETEETEQEEAEQEEYDKEKEEFSLDDYIDDEEFPDYKLYANNTSPDDEVREIPFVAGISFFDFLDSQLGLRDLTDREMIIARTIIGNLDDAGYLQRDIGAMVDDLAFSQNIQTTRDEILDILMVVQEFDPPGVGARNLQECLIIQLKRNRESNNPKAIELAILILEKYFNEFTKKHYDKILHKAKVTEDQLRKAIEEILRLNPKPGNSLSETARTNYYIMPDFIIQDRDGETELVLNSRNVPELRLNRTYLEMLEGYAKSKNKKTVADKEAFLFIKQKLDSAKWFIDAIKQRQNTLYVTMNAILEYQKEYFETGDETKLKPMILKDIAEIVGLDISTISRVANSKYVQTPYGTFLLKSFFSESLQNDSGEEVSTREIKKILSDCVEAEDKGNPLTDEELMQTLKEKGYNIARRTVAKYREQLNIPVARLRREL
jgi:RNA polymerase sigma-54 factor